MQQKSFREALAEANRRYQPVTTVPPTEVPLMTLEEMFTPQGQLLTDIFTLTKRGCHA